MFKSQLACAAAFFSKAKSEIDSVIDANKHNLTDYIQEELLILPSKEAVLDYIEDVDTLKMDVDRLHARIKRLEG